MDRDTNRAVAKLVRLEISLRLRAYYASLCLGLAEDAAELLDRAERLASKREPEVPNHPGYPLT